MGDDLFVESYRNRIFSEFRPLEIAGLPAVQLSAGSQVFTCTTTVGVAEMDAVDINTSVESSRGRPMSDPCEDGRRVAEAVVSTLPPQS